MLFQLTGYLGSAKKHPIPFYQFGMLLVKVVVKIKFIRENWFTFFMRAWQTLLGSMFSSKMLLHVPLVVERVLANIANPKESARFTNHFGQVVSRSQKGSCHTWNGGIVWGIGQADHFQIFESRKNIRTPGFKEAKLSTLLTWDINSNYRYLNAT